MNNQFKCFTERKVDFMTSIILKDFSAFQKEISSSNVPMEVNISPCVVQEQSRMQERKNSNFLILSCSVTWGRNSNTFNRHKMKEKIMSHCSFVKQWLQKAKTFLFLNNTLAVYITPNLPFTWLCVSMLVSTNMSRTFPKNESLLAAVPMKNKQYMKTSENIFHKSSRIWGMVIV